jgi:hypothetical protein
VLELAQVEQILLPSLVQEGLHLKYKALQAALGGRGASQQRRSATRLGFVADGLRASGKEVLIGV